MRQKTVWITGASRGIGRQAALDFGRQGWNVVIHCHTHREEAEAVRQSIGRNAIVTAGDVASREEVHAVYQKALDAFGRVDVLINNAAVASQELFTEMQEENWRRIFAVNVEGVYHCTQTVLPDMIRRREGSLLFGDKGRCDRNDKGPGKGSGPFGHPGQLRGTRGDRHRNERPFERSGYAGFGRGYAAGAVGRTGGYFPCAAIFGLGRCGFHHWTGFGSQRRICDLNI